MKLLTIDAPPGGHAGVLTGPGDVLDLAILATNSQTARLLPTSLRGILATGPDGLELVRRCIGEVEAMSNGEREGLGQAGGLRALGQTPLLAPIPDPALLLSVGRNYGRHLKEMQDSEVPACPTAFIKTTVSLNGSGKPIRVPPQCSDMIDYEGEFCFVFGADCFDVGADEALEYVAGYTIANDVSARDWVPEVRSAETPFDGILAWERNIMGKNLPGFTPCGPVITTRDEISDPHDLQLATRLNGEEMQSTKTDDLIFKLPELISYFSKWYRFQPGDVVTTGSPAGVGFGRNPPVFMKPGDVVEVEIEGIGTLTNTLEET